MKSPSWWPPSWLRRLRGRKIPRLTGVSLPLGGLQWEYPASEREKIAALFDYLESRRALWIPFDSEDYRRTTPARREQIREHHLGEQHPPVLGQQPKHAASIDQMTRDRLGIQKLTLIKRRILHTPIVPTPRNQRPPRHALFSRVLAPLATG